MLGTEDRTWYSDQYFFINDDGMVVSKWTEKIVGVFVNQKVDTNYLVLYHNDAPETTQFEEVANLGELDSKHTSFWSKFKTFWRL
jgi:hypothetical protein